MKPLLKAALEYERRGFSVIPIRPASKKPMIAWAKYHNERATPSQIMLWWERWPSANVGIVTGRISGVVAIDIDAEPDPNFTSLLTETGLVAATGSGGKHMLYATREAVPNRVALTEGVDVRGDGGFIVVPPSVHPNGIPYRWLHKDDPAPLPAPLLSAIRDATPTNDDSHDHWLDKLMQGVPSGQRNASATRLAGYLISKQMPRDVVLTLMRQWNDKNTPPMPEDELQRTIDSIQVRDSKSKSQDTERQDKQHSGAKLSLMKFGQFMQEHGETEVVWTIDSWLPDRTIAFAIAPPGTFKTWMLFDAALSIATGTPFLGRYPVRRRGPVLIFQQEDFRGTMAERFALVVNSKFPMGSMEDGYIPPPEIPLFIHLDRELRFADRDAMASLREQIAKIKPVLVVIDPLYSAASTDDYMSKAAEQMLALKGLRDEFGCSFLIAHHTKKSAEDSAREGLWGSQFLNALLETGWQIRANKDSVIVRRHFKSSKDEPIIKLTFNISDKMPYRYEVEEGEADGESSSVADRILAALPATGSQLAEKLGVNRSTITRALQTLKDDKLVVRDGKGVYSIPTLD